MAHAIQTYLECQFGITICYVYNQINNENVLLVADVLDAKKVMYELDYLFCLRINFIQYGQLKAKMKTLKGYYQLEIDPTIPK